MQKVTMLLVCCLASASFALAGPGHPAMHRPIGQRIGRQNARIRAGRRDGDLTNAQARQLHGEEHGVREQAQAERTADGGRLTRGQHRQIEHELNQDSRQIHAEKKAGE